MRKIYLLDSNAISECAKPAPNKNFLEKVSQHKKECAISAISWYEIQFGVNRMSDGRKKEFLKRYYENLKIIYEFLDYDIRAAEINAEINAKLEKIGKTPQFPDAQIAAIAICHNLILITNNTADFVEICKITDLHIENWNN